MSVFALLASGFLAGILFVVLCAIIGLRACGDRVDDLSDQCADEGGRAIRYTYDTVGNLWAHADWPRVDPAFHEGADK